MPVVNMFDVHPVADDETFESPLSAHHVLHQPAVRVARNAVQLIVLSLIHIYVCCSSAFPNTFTFSEPWEAVYMAWFAAACGYDGMLRWSYNSWPADPVRDSRFTAWPAGDTYLVYPDAHSSIRFERLRDCLLYTSTPFRGDCRRMFP